MQIAQLVYSLPESQRTLEDVGAAAEGLETAIDSFSAIAKSPNPPFPRGELEQRANMGRNTMRKQLDRALQSQKEYEEKNAARLQQARETREAELKRREEAKRQAEEAANEQRRKIAEERQRMQEHDRELAELRAEQDRAKEEADKTTDSETGEKKPRTRRKGAGKRKKKGETVETDGDGTETGRRSRQTSNTVGSSDDGKPRRTKKRRLERKAKGTGKIYKSSELVVESDSDEAVANLNGEIVATNETDGDNAVVPGARKKASRVIEDDDEDGDESPQSSRPAQYQVSEGDGDAVMVDAPEEATNGDSDA